MNDPDSRARRFMECATVVTIIVMLLFGAMNCRSVMRREYTYEITQERMDQAIRDLEALGLERAELEAAIKNMKSRYKTKGSSDEQSQENHPQPSH